MDCHHRNCDTCPYPDCILNDEEALIRAREEGMYDEEIAERAQRRLEARRAAKKRWNQRNKEKVREYVKNYERRKREAENGL